MAIEKKLIHFSKLSDFQTQLNAGNILDYSIVFIQDAKRIWTRGNYYYCNEVNLDDYLTAEEIAELYATQEWANEAQEFINDLNTDVANLYADKQDALISGENIKTINGQSLLGSGNIVISGGGGNSDANVSAVDTSETLDDVSGVTYVKYVAQTLTEAQKAQARANIGALSADDQETVDLSNYYTKEEIDSQLGDINSILESIISGGGASIITFYINQTFIATTIECQAEDGMTWEEWCNSSYNTFGYYIEGTSVTNDDGVYIVLDGINVSNTDIIQSGVTYKWG